MHIHHAACQESPSTHTHLYTMLSKLACVIAGFMEAREGGGAVVPPGALHTLGSITATSAGCGDVPSCVGGGLGGDRQYGQ